LLPGNADGKRRRTSAGVKLVTKPEKSFLMNPHPDRFLFGTATLSTSERIEGGIDSDQCHVYHPSTIALLPCTLVDPDDVMVVMDCARVTFRRASTRCLDSAPPESIEV
jgi:hypothetical protein